MVAALVFFWLKHRNRYSEQHTRVRVRRLSALAEQLGLQFDRTPDYETAKGFRFLNELSRGDNRYAYNVMWGSYCGYEVRMFDFYYQTYSENRGRVRVHEHHLSAVVLRLDRQFPELTICPERLASKTAHTLGCGDIDFESYEFSRKYCVRCKDRKFAYDVCNARMIEYLLSQPELKIEIEGPALAISHDQLATPEAVEGDLERLVRIRSLIPEYLFC